MANANQPQQKFGRSYLLSAQTLSGNTLQVKPPFTIEFDIQRNILSSTSVASIRILNLSMNSRKQLLKNVTDYDLSRVVQLDAGYGNRLGTMFVGNITQAWSVREGVNFVTTIESLDGGFAFTNSRTDRSYPVGIPNKTVITDVVSDLKPTVTLGAIGDFPGSTTRGNTYSDSTVSLAKQLTNGNFFVDNSKAHCLNPNEYIDGTQALIDSSTGLLGTPMYENTLVTFDMILDPTLYIGQLVNLQSATEKTYNGFSKIVALKHRGMISESVCGDAITTVSVRYGIPNLKAVKPIS